MNNEQSEITEKILILQNELLETKNAFLLFEIKDLTDQLLIMLDKENEHIRK